MNNYFLENRKKVFSSMKDNTTLLICSGDEKHKSGDENYPFCVNKNFYYLTGLDKPMIFLVMTKINNQTQCKIISPKFEKSAWVTPNFTISEIKKISKVENVEYYDGKFIIPTIETKILYLDETNDVTKNFTFENNLKIENAFNLIATFRSIKNDYEIKQIKKAINITHKGLLNLFKNLNTCSYEYQTQSLFEGEIKYNNSQDLAFATICAGGKNACTLHYSKNSDKLIKGELLLLDLGAKFNHFSADISRTIPYKSKFNKRQKYFYNLVLEIQQKVIDAIKPGITVLELNNLVIDFYYENLKKINLIKTRDEVKKYYMHSVGHSLGLDTHDEGFLRSQPLVKGNVITVEPGIYIPEYNIGIRIEDDVLVTENGSEVLSKKIPKSINALNKIINYREEK